MQNEAQQRTREQNNQRFELRHGWSDILFNFDYRVYGVLGNTVVNLTGVFEYTA